jgi:ankyrin repeat protein
MDLTIGEPSVTDDLCFTPLHHVVIGLKQADLRQQLNITTMYIDTPDSFGRSLLHWAVIMGNCAAIEALIDHKASPTCVDRERMTPLHDIYLAPPSAQAQCGRLLLGARAEVDALDFWGRTPLRIAVGYSSISLDFLTILINNGADVNLRDLYSQTPVLKSIQGRREITQLLLNHGADAAARDGYGNTPVLEAIYRNKPQHLQLLIEHGAKTNDYFHLKPGRRARDGQIHLLDFVAWYGSVEIMRILENSPTQHYHLSQPLDTVEQYHHFRLANGRKAGVAEHEAFLRLLSKMEFSYETCRPSDFADGESDDEEIFVDAHDSFLEENVLTV